MKRSHLKTTRVLAVAAICLVGLAIETGSATAAATPAWRLLAGVGPTHLPPEQSETQRVTVEAEGGTFTLTQQTGTGTGDLDVASGFGSYAEGVTEIEVLQFFPTGTFAVGQTIVGPGIPPGTTITAVKSAAFGKILTLSAPTTAGNFFETVTAASNVVANLVVGTGGFRLGDSIAGTGIPDGTTIAAVGPGTLTLSALPTSGGPTSLTARETTSAIPAAAPASGPGSVEEALNALPAFGPGTVGVIREQMQETGFGTRYFVTFGGSYADQDLDPLTADGTALVGPHANIDVFTTLNGGPGTGKIVAYPINVGGSATTGPITVTIGPLPAGVLTAGAGTGEDWTCPGGAGESTATCTTTDAKRAGLALSPLAVPLEVETPSSPGGEVEVSVSGGGAGSWTYQVPLVVSGQPAKPGTEAFIAGAFDEAGAAAVQAGGHPEHAISGFLRNTVRSSSGEIVPAGDPRDIRVDLPPGFVGNPLVTPRCPQSRLTCELLEARVGILQVGTATFGNTVETGAGLAGLANDVPPKGFAAEFSGTFGIPTASLLGSLRSDEDYGVTVSSFRTSSYYKIFSVFASFEGQPSGAAGKAMFSNPTACHGGTANGLTVALTADTWQEPGLFTSASEAQPPVQGCDQLEFGTPDVPVGFTFQPTTQSAATGTGATAELTVDQAGLTDPDKLATPHLKKSVVTLPEGLVLNPAAANGLAACSTQQVGLKGTGFPAPNPIRFDMSPVTCPDAAKIGTAEVATPLLEQPVDGTLYLAAQGDNPFSSLLAMYIVVEDEQSGVVLKLPGEVAPDPATGRLTATFDNNPQAPFTSLTLKIRGGGPHSTMATPDVCGKYTTNGTFTPWSAPESGPSATTQDSFDITSGVGGATCPKTKAQRPFALGFEAGTTNPTAGAHSPFTLRVTRPDGNQELDTISATVPQGVLATLKGVGICSQAAIAKALSRSKPGDGAREIQDPSCPPGSQVGTTTIGAGVGSDPIYVKTGRVYLTGPYKGAPASLAFVVPAVAGPFDLGVQVVRTALEVDPKTAQVTAVSDPIPQILSGIPVQIRDVVVNVDRGGFILNPTNCEAMAVTAKVGGGSGATANLQNRFQVDGCKNLPFKPKLQLKLEGKTKRSSYQRLTATLTAKPGEANIAGASVTMPHSIFLAQEHIRTVCTRVQFAADSCPKGSIYGRAEATTPLIDGKLQGPVYLRSSDNVLPDLVAALKGPDAQPIEVELSGRTDSKNQGIRNTFDIVPDAPVSKFTLRLSGGSKSLLVASRNLCRGGPQRATVRMSAHNGKRHDFRPALKVKCGKKGKAKRK